MPATEPLVRLAFSDRVIKEVDEMMPYLHHPLHKSGFKRYYGLAGDWPTSARQLANESGLSLRVVKEHMNNALACLPDDVACALRKVKTG